jgi:hypothetical protein
MLIEDFRMRRGADLVLSFRAHQRDGTKLAGKKMCWPLRAWDSFNRRGISLGV